MDKAARVAMYKEFLEELGYRPEIDKDGDVKFRREGGLYIAIVEEDDARFFRLAFPGFWSIDSAEERAKVVLACVKATAETKVAKVFPVKNNVWATIEMFCDPPEVVKPVLERCIKALAVSVKMFVEEMKSQSTAG